MRAGAQCTFPFHIHRQKCQKNTNAARAAPFWRPPCAPLPSARLPPQKAGECPCASAHKQTTLVSTTPLQTHLVLVNVTLSASSCVLPTKPQRCLAAPWRSNTKAKGYTPTVGDVHMESAPQLAKQRRARAWSAHCMLCSLPGSCGPAGQGRRPGACLRCGHPSCRPRHARRARAQSAQQARPFWWCPLLLWACLQQVQSAWLEISKSDAPQPMYLPVCIGKALAQTIDSRAHMFEREDW